MAIVLVGKFVGASQANAWAQVLYRREDYAAGYVVQSAVQVLGTLVFFALSGRASMRRYAHSRPPLLRTALLGAAVATAALVLDALNWWPMLWKFAAGPTFLLFAANNGSILGVALCLVRTTVVVPFLEEVVFRGALLTALRDRTGSTPVAVALSAVAFGLVHLDSARVTWINSAWAAAFGLLLGLIAVRDGGVQRTAVMHGARNATDAIFPLAAGILGP